MRFFRQKEQGVTDFKAVKALSGSGQPVVHFNAVPLIGLDAVALDTEATGLDPRKARVVEIGAVRLLGDALKSGAHFRRLVRPGTKIPAAAVRIHGIDETMLTEAADFAGVWPDFAEYLGNEVVIGHTTGFDVALLTSELERIGKTWPPRPILDVRVLAQIARPDLAGYSLEELAGWLDINITKRHSALGDATAAADIFRALIPKLRACGIRTLAEAIRASERLKPPQNALPLASLLPPSVPSPKIRRADADTHPYRHQVSDFMAAPAKWVAADTTIGTALQRMSHERISSLFVTSGKEKLGTKPEQAGIVTERDILRALDAQGAAALELPIGRIMSQPLSTVPANALAYLAIARMNRRGFRHLGVTDDAGDVIGALSARDLLKFRAQAGVYLGDEIDHAKDTGELARAWGTLAPRCGELYRDGLTAIEIAAVISQQVQQLTRRAALLAEDVMRDGGHDGPPCAYAFVVLGSAGRGESLLAMDQDNAIITTRDTSAEEDRWFQVMAEHVSDILHAVGIPYCKGGVMARNAQWRGSRDLWRKRLEGWIGRSDPQDLLSIDIFFDLKGVHGEMAAADTVWRAAFDAAKGNAAFAKLLIETTGQAEPGLTWFGGFRTNQGRIDLKKSGLLAVVSAARALAICHHIIERPTPARLDGIKTLLQTSEDDLDGLTEAHGVFLELILKQQLQDIEVGLAPTNKIEVSRLSRRDKRRLSSALRSVQNLDEITRSLLFRA